MVPVEIESDNSEGDSTNHNIRALPNSSIFSDLKTKTLGRLKSGANSLRIKSSASGASSMLGVPIYTLGGDELQIRDNDYEFTPEKYKALSYTVYTVKSMTNESDILMMNIIINDLVYTGVGDKDSKRKTFFTKKLPKLVEQIPSKTFDEITNDSDDLQGEGVEIIIPSNIIDTYTRLEILLGLNLSGHTGTLTEASNLIDELYKRVEIQNEQQYRDAINKFQTV